MLDIDQQKVHDLVINSKGERILINGSAGTGKTYLAASIIDTLLADTRKPILVSAPTHEALNVLKNKLEHVSTSRVSFQTIQSALQLTRVIGPEGNIYFTRDKYAKEVNPIYENHYGVCIIDEGSMLESNLVSAIEKLESVKVIILGDIKQINPVGEDISPVFSRGFETYTLETQKRQTENNPIIDISMNPNKLALKTNCLVGATGYIFDNNLDNIIKRLAKDGGKGDVVYLGWTNAEVNKINRLVRNKIYTNPSRYMLGETVIFDRPYSIFHNRQKIKITDIKVAETELIIPTVGTLTVVSKTGKLTGGVKAKFKTYRINNAITALHEDSILAFKNVADIIKEKCEKREMSWKLYYGFIEQVASLKYSYAITTHTSQGSTFFCTIVNVGDIYRNSNRREAARLLYTAMTRSSNITIFYNT